MNEIVKILILGILFAIVAIITFSILDDGEEQMKKHLLQVYGFEKEGAFWVKLGHSIATETVEKMSIFMLVDYLEACNEDGEDPSS